MTNTRLIAAACIFFPLLGIMSIASAESAGSLPSPNCASLDGGTLTLHVPCLNLGGSPYWFDAVYCSKPVHDAYIVTVDGLDMVNTLMNSDIPDDDRYLYRAVESFNICGNASSLAFTWSRNARDTAAAVMELRQWLQSHYTDAQANRKKFIVISHSWGTFLTYAALHYEPSIAVDLYITLASPIGTRLHPRGGSTIEGNIVNSYVQGWLFKLGLPSEDHRLANVRTAVNYWAYGDLISGPLFIAPDASNIMVDSAENNNYKPGIQSTEKWHKYDSLQPGSDPDNQPLRDMVAGDIFAALGGRAVGFSVADAGLSSGLPLPDTLQGCSEYAPADNTIHIPCLSLGSATFWIDLLPRTAVTPLLLELGGFGENAVSVP